MTGNKPTTTRYWVHYTRASETGQPDHLWTLEDELQDAEAQAQHLHEWHGPDATVRIVDTHKKHKQIYHHTPKTGRYSVRFNKLEYAGCLYAKETDCVDFAMVYATNLLNDRDDVTGCHIFDTKTGEIEHTFCTPALQGDVPKVPVKFTPADGEPRDTNPPRYEIRFETETGTDYWCGRKNLKDAKNRAKEIFDFFDGERQVWVIDTKLKRVYRVPPWDGLI